MSFQNIIEMELDENSKHKEPSVMTILKPIIRVNQFFGVCPHEISGDNLIFRWTSFRFFHTMFTVSVLSLYFIYLVCQFVQSFSKGRGTPEMVVLALWLGGTLVPILMVGVTIWKRNRMTLFFDKMYEYKGPLQGIMKCEKIIRYSRRLYGLYIFLALISCSFHTLSILRNPTSDTSLLSNFVSDGEVPSTGMVAIACIFQVYLVILKACTSAYIEVFCSSLSYSFVSTVHTIVKELQKNLDGSPRLQRPFAMDPIQETKGKEMENHPHIRNVNDHYIHHIPIGGELYPQIPSMKGYATSMDSCGNYYAESVTEGACPIILAMKRFNCMANMQGLINCIFGTILALDTGLLVFMSCLLLYLQINYLGSSYVDKLDGIIFSGTSICFFIRLVIMFISLGNVHSVSICFNGKLTSSLMQVKKPKSMDVNLILAHLATHSANPVSYNAGGFFIFSKSSLLTVFSVIMTYVVFLLQARN